MAGNNAIQILRGNNESVLAKDIEDLLPGEPLFINDPPLLFVGRKYNPDVHDIPDIVNDPKTVKVHNYPINNWNVNFVDDLGGATEKPLQVRVWQGYFDRIEGGSGGGGTWVWPYNPDISDYGDPIIIRIIDENGTDIIAVGDNNRGVITTGRDLDTVKMTVYFFIYERWNGEGGWPV